MMRVRDHGVEDYKELLDMDATDVGVLACDADLPRSPYLEYEPLFSEPLCVLMPAGHPLARAKIELDRLKMSLRDNFVTPWVKANGFGGIDPARLAKSIDQIALTYDFKNRPRPEDIFTSQYLPPAAERKL